jgi:predicted nucleic acid-binding protein
VSTFVVDASVVIKWLVPETGSVQALALARQGHRLVAPELHRAEVANALGRKRRSGELTSAEARLAVELAERAPIDVLDSAGLLVAAFDLAAALDRTVYDSLYVALALREGCQFVTADARLHRSVAEALPGVTVLLGDL